MSDTPISDSTPHNVADLGMLCRRLERELNAANAIIRQQQLLDEENLRLQERIKRLEEWKESAMAVEREWNPNSLSKMLGGQLGESQRKVIQREVPKLLIRIKLLEEAGDALEYASVVLEAGEDPNGFEKLLIAQRAWLKAKEANP
jgi:hypothetical protein